MLDNGDEFEARVVASNLDPKTTFLSLVATKELPEEFVDGIRKFRCEGTSLKINFALRGLPEFTLPARRARAAAPRDDAHLPFDRIRRARLG